MKISEINRHITGSTEDASSFKGRPLADHSAESSIYSIKIKTKNRLWKKISSAGKKLIFLISQVIDKIKSRFNSSPGKGNTPLLSIEEFEDQSAESPKEAISADAFKALPQLSEAEKKRIEWLLQVLAQNDISWLFSHAKEVQFIGSQIRSDHSLRNTEYVLSNPSLKKNLLTIPQRWFVGSQVWKQCVPLLGKGLKARMGSPVFERELHGFATIYKLDFEKMKRLLNSHNWDAFFRYVFEIN